MKISWKVVYAFLCFLAVFLIPLAYAEETVSVSFYKDGEKIENPKVGDKVTVHAELIKMNSADYITLTLEDDSLKFTSNPNSKTTNVYGRAQEGNVWVYETEVEVLTDNPKLPKAQVVRDSSEPKLDNADKPTSVSIDLNSEQLVSPGDTISAKAKLEPSETVAPEYYNYLEWSVTYGDKTIELDKSTGEAIEFTVPEDALNTKIAVSAVIKGEKCGLSGDISAKTVGLKVNDESLSIRIFPSTDSEGVLKGKYLGFSSELLRDGKVAEDAAREEMTCWWTAQMGQQFLNGSGRNSDKFTISPEENGTLTVYLSVTLKNGVTLESNKITKTVVDSGNTLESIELKQLETGETQVGDTVGVSYKLSPQYVTNLDGASYKWEAVLGEEKIASSDKLEDFNFKASKSGVIKVTLTITPKDADPVKSNVLEINVLDNAPTKIISGDIKTEQDTNSLKVGDTLTLNADLVTEGDGDISYNWKAADNKGEVIAESEELKDFTVTPQKAGNVIVTFTAKVNTGEVEIQEDSDNYRAIKLIESFSFQDPQNPVPVQEEVTDKTDNGSNNQEENTVKEDNSIESPKVEEPSNTEQNTVKEEKSEPDQKTEQPETPQQETNVGATDEKLIQRNINNESVTQNDPVTSQGNDSEVTKVNSSLEGIVTTPEEQAKNAAIENKQAKEQVTANTTKQTNEPNAGAVSTKSTSTNDNTEVGANKTSSTNSTTPTSGSSRLGQNSTATKVVTTSTPQQSTTKQVTAGQTTQTSNVFNKSANVENPKTGTDFTIGQLMVIFVCSFLIIVSTVILFRKRHQS